MTPEQQLALWVQGINKHNDERDECCPDFACCQTSNHWPIELRLTFQKLYDEGGSEAIEPMLMMSIRSLIGDTTETYFPRDIRTMH